MLGAIIGDIVGSRFEFDPTNDYNFEFFSEECSFTDDTICTIAVADALLSGKEYGEKIQEWCRKYPHPMGGYGRSFVRWIADDERTPYGSYGNGAAMKIAPIGHWYKSREKCLLQAAKVAEVSHNHVEGIKGAQTVALAINMAMKFNRGHYQEAPWHIDEIINACVDFSGYDIEMPKSSVLNKFDETCQGTVPVALKIISISGSFEDAVRLAVSLGADADTLGAIVGSIAESIWGIPMEMRDKVENYLPEEMQVVVRRFYHACPNSFKPLIDTTFGETHFRDVAWDLLDEDERDETEAIVTSMKNDIRSLMAERAEKRKLW